MKTVFSLVVVLGVAFFMYENSKNKSLSDLNNISDLVDTLSTQYGSGNKTQTQTESDNQPTEPSEPVEHSKEAINYFNTICRGSEYGSGDQISKWNSDVKVYVMGQKRDYLMDEFKSIVNELNSYIDPINIKFVNSRSEANFVVVFGSAQDYVNVEPYAANYVEDNWGLFTTNSGSVIYDANMFVDIFRCTDIDGQKHLLREEFTQALGFKQDSYDYPNSMFYQGWTTTTEYAPIDVEIIKMLYNE
jgi:hypothetical protein